MLVVKLDSSKETEATKKFIANKFQFPGELQSFSETNPFQGKNISDLRQIATLSHGSERSLGDFDDADEFVARFVKNFKDAKFSDQDKLQVTDLYLIGCEIGKFVNGTCLAQIIANKLAANGFKNIKIHAVTVPQNHPKQTGDLIVEITSGQGQLGAALNALRAQGGVKAEQYEGQIGATIGGKLFLTAGEPIHVLNYAQNIFVPGKTHQQHLKRIKDASIDYDNVRLILEKRIKVLEAEIARKQDVESKTRNVNILKNALTKLNASYAEQWHSILEQIKNDIPKNGTTKELLSLMLDRKFEKAEKLVNEGMEKYGLKDDRHIQIQSKLPHEDTAPMTGAATQDPATQPLLSDYHPRPSSPPRTNSPVISPSAKSSAQAAPLSAKDIAEQPYEILKQRQFIIRQVSEYKKQLEKDISGRSHFSFLFPNTKQIKVAKLEQLVGTLNKLTNPRTKTDEDFNSPIRAALADKDVTYGIFTSRTKNLLENILDGHPERYIETPLPKPEAGKQEGGFMNWITSIFR